MTIFSYVCSLNMSYKKDHIHHFVKWQEGKNSYQKLSNDKIKLFEIEYRKVAPWYTEHNAVNWRIQTLHEISWFEVEFCEVVTRWFISFPKYPTWKRVTRTLNSIQDNLVIHEQNGYPIRPQVILIQDKYQSVQK